MAGTTISSGVAATVTLNSPGYPSPLTITGSGTVNGASYGAIGIFGPVSNGAGSVINQGAVSGAGGGKGQNAPTGTYPNINTTAAPGGAGGGGIILDAGSYVGNSGMIAGGNGGVGGGYFRYFGEAANGTPAGTGGSGGSGVSLANGTINNASSGIIAGGAGGMGGYSNYTPVLGGTGGQGGTGVSLQSGSLINAGTILGGAGGSGGQFLNTPPRTGGEGGDGAVLVDADLTNTGVIQGGNVGAGFYTLSGGTALQTSGGSIDNSGRIIGGSVGGGGIGANLLSGATLTNTGTILGGSGVYDHNENGSFSGGPGGVGVDVSGGSVLTNNALIQGGVGGNANPLYVNPSGGGAGGTGITIASGTVINNGTIAGGTGGNGSTHVAPGTAGIGAYISGGGTLINDAVINAGTQGNGSTGIGNAVQFGGAGGTLVDMPGATFSGAVNGEDALNSSIVSVLHFASGASVVTLTSALGPEFIGFSQVDIDPGADWVLAGANQITGKTDFTNFGTLSNLGVITDTAAFNNQATFVNSGTFLANTATLTNLGTVSGSGTVELGPVNTLAIAGAGSQNQTLIFEAGNAQTLILTSPGSVVANTITGLNTFDRIDLGGGETATSATLVNGNTIAVLYTLAAGGGGTIDLTSVGFASGSSKQFTAGYDPSTGDSFVEVGSRNTRPTLTTLVNFNNTDGATPQGPLIADANGDLFGTTEDGGTSSSTVFELVDTDGTFASTPTVLADLPALAEGGVVADASGDLFGTEIYGGANSDGAVFEIANTSGTFSTGASIVASFNGTDGSALYGELVIDANGNLIGTAFHGGAHTFGSVFEISNSSGTFSNTPSVLVSLTSTNLWPEAGLLQDGSGNLFGVGTFGGSSDGSVFEITQADGTYASAATALATFNGTDGQNPQAPLIEDANGDLFGTTPLGGSTGDGVVFEVIKANGTYSAPTPLVTFNFSDGAEPFGGLVMDANGDLFGTTKQGGTSSDGTVFEIVDNNGTYSSTPIVLANFNSTNGASPLGALYADSSGDLFGTTSGGGTNGDGTVFEITDSGFVACFAAGTRIRTVRGDKPVEDLCVGDLLPTTVNGSAAPVIWIGRRRINCRRHLNAERVWPIRIAAEAFGPDLPSSDLWLSPDHAVYTGSVLIPVKYLVNGSSITQQPVDHITYYHVELARHDVILAEALPVESFLASGDHGFFGRGGAPLAVYPDFTCRVWDGMGCAPLVVTGQEVERVRRLLNERAAANNAKFAQAA